MALLLLLATLAALACYGFSQYRRLVTLREAVDGAWGDVDRLLLRRHDELSRLLGADQASAWCPPALLQRLAKFRVAAFEAAGRRDVMALGTAESLLRHGLGEFNAAVGEQPALRPLLGGIDGLNGRFIDCRETYNVAASVYNVRMDGWPGRLIAGLCGFRGAVLFEFSAGTPAHGESGP